jgi:hypothetical protein
VPGGLGPWLGWGLGFFIVGWLVQFVGHYYEGRKPAFADDLVGLLVGPMFVVMEMLALWPTPPRAESAQSGHLRGREWLTKARAPASDRADGVQRQGSSPFRNCAASVGSSSLKKRSTGRSTRTRPASR